MIPLSRPASLGSVTVADVIAAEDTARHIETVQRWARSAWHAWSEHHETVRRWASLA
jgi:hypothetical protein